MADILISFRFGESLAQGTLLKEELERKGLRVHMGAFQEGENMARALAEHFPTARVVVILGTESYGEQTKQATYSTYDELLRIVDARKPIFLVKMCDRYKSELARSHLGASAPDFIWPQNTWTIPADLVQAIVTRLESVPTVDSTSVSNTASTVSNRAEQMVTPAETQVAEGSSMSERHLEDGRNHTLRVNQSDATTTNSELEDHDPLSHLAETEAQGFEGNGEMVNGDEEKREEFHGVGEVPKAERSVLATSLSASLSDTGVASGGTSDASERRKALVEAEQAVAKEKAAWKATGKVGYMTQLGKNGLFSRGKPKRMFFMLNSYDAALKTYADADSTGLVGVPKGKPVSVFWIRYSTTCTPINKPKHPLGKNVILVRDEYHGSLELGCASQIECQEWMDAVKLAATGFTPSRPAQEALSKARALVHGDSIRKQDQEETKFLAPDAQAQISRIEQLLEEGLLTANEVTELRRIIVEQDRENRALSRDPEYGEMAQIEQLAKIDSLFADGLISSAEADELRTAITGQDLVGQSVSSGRTSFRQSVKMGDLGDDLGYSAGGSSEVMAVCEVCSILNMHGGAQCMVCGATLPKDDWK